MNSQETIAAPITASGQAGVTVIRTSGSLTREILHSLTDSAAEIIENPRELKLARVLDSRTTLDRALVVYFPGPGSFTGEDCAEFHLHGSPYLRARLLELLAENGVRLAGPGEFTERAFHNGKIDLAQAEAVADLIASETDAQAKAAESQLSGQLSGAIADLGEPLRNLLAEIEAHIDFPDEDIDPESWSGWKSRVDSVKAQLNQYLASYSRGKLVREGARVTLLGVPNAGKSSLLNRILGEERVIVTPVAGTTRDSVEARISIHGVPVSIFDTAGLESEQRKAGEIEKLGVEKSWQAASEADLNLFVYDSSQGEPDRELLSKLENNTAPTILVANKSDLKGPKKESNAVIVSAHTGSGIESLLKEIAEALSISHKPNSGEVLITSIRHFTCLETSSSRLDSALEGCSSQVPAELVAADIRSALSSLDEIIGVTENEDILGRIFSKFCVGK